MEYARDLGYCAGKYLIEGGNAAMVSMSHGAFMAIPFESIMDRTTGRVRVRMVDIDSDRYMIARRYMLRLRRDDFDDPNTLAKFASVLGISIEEFERQFEYLIEDEPVPRLFFDGPEGTPLPPHGTPSARPSTAGHLPPDAGG
jgi:6-phosphofructokinase 1